MDPNPDHLYDEQILAGLRGDEQTRLTALRRAMEKYTYRLGGLARKYLGASDPHDVVDVVDRTFQALWEKHEAIERCLWSWLAGVAVNQAITFGPAKIPSPGEGVVQLAKPNVRHRPLIGRIRRTYVDSPGHRRPLVRHDFCRIHQPVRLLRGEVAANAESCRLRFAGGGKTER